MGTGVFISLPGFDLALAQPVAWGGKWRTLVSPHFELHFQEELRDLAQRCLVIAEDVHRELLPHFRSQPAAPVHMVLSDEVDFANGWATVLPFAQIRLFVSRPEDAATLERYDEWMRILIRHEYVHILHMEMGKGFVSVGRNIFGRLPLFFPHALTPTFLLEGLAVYFEGYGEEGAGRLHGSHYEAQMRQEIVENRWKSLSQVVADLREWPLGKAYLYGAFFVDYLAREYGEDAIFEFLYRQSGELIPFFTLNAQARRVFGKNFPGLWEDFRQDMVSRFSEEAPETVLAGEMRPSGNFFMQVAASRGDAFYLVEDSGEDRRRLFRYGGGTRKAEIFTRSLADLSIREDGCMAATRITGRADGRFFHDVFFHEASGGWRRLTYGMRFKRVRWLPGEEALLVSRQEGGISELHILDLKGQSRLVWQGKEGEVLAAFDVAGEKGPVVAALKRPGLGWNLELLDLAAQSWQPLTRTPEVENEPQFLPDGRILFSADYGGTYNIHVLDPETGWVEQWTDVSGGAFRPRWAGREGLFYQAYTAEGYRLFQVQHPQPLRAFSVEDKPLSRQSSPILSGSFPLIREKNYSPWPSLKPRYWFPVWQFDGDSGQIGIQTGGNDALGRHVYLFSGTFDVKNDLTNGQLVYGYDNRWSLMLERSHRFSERSLGEGTLKYTLRKDEVTLQRSHLLSFFEDRMSLHAGLVHERESLLDFPFPVRRKDTETSLAGLGLTFEDEEMYLNVPGIGWGLYADLAVESNDLLPGDYRGLVVQSRIRKIWDLPGRSTLGIRLAGGHGDEEARPFYIGGVQALGDRDLFGREEAELRGYPRSVQRGDRYFTQRIFFNPWLYRVERNLSLMPLGMGDLSASLFLDSGSAWRQGESMHQLTGLGLEFRMDLLLAYHLRVPLILGYARGLDADLGEDQFYTALGFVF